MLKINLEHSQTDFKDAAEELEKIKQVPLPDFVKFETDFEEIERLAKKYQHYPNLIVVGNGGAINSFRGFYFALAKNRSKKIVEILNTVEPDLINDLKLKYFSQETLVIIVSKSGANPTVLEIMFAFREYPRLVVCTEGLGALYQIVKREKLDYLQYPSHQEFSQLDDRHTGISASGLIPAALLGINVREIYAGAKGMYQKCSPKVSIKDNPALQLAAALYLLEKKNYLEIFCPVYSTKLSGFLPGMIQFLHETVCKDGAGQTIFGDLAPESQHHTNQRLFGGRKNMLAFFLTAQQKDQDLAVEIPLELTDIPLRTGILEDFNNIPYAKLLEFEFRGTLNDAVDQKIPAIHLDFQDISPKSVGEFLALLQYVAIYSAYLRGVNPYGQPQVERSKEISFELVKKFRAERK